MNKSKLEDLIDAVENATRDAVNTTPGAFDLAVKMATDHRSVDPGTHTVAGAIAVSKSIAAYVDAACADGTLTPYGADAHAKIDASAKVLRAALAALDGLHKEFPAEEKRRADA
jgi:hypothetical protein